MLSIPVHAGGSVLFCKDGQSLKGSSQQSFQHPQQPPGSHLLDDCAPQDADKPIRAYLQAMEETTTANHALSLHPTSQTGVHPDIHLSVTDDHPAAPLAAQPSSCAGNGPFAELEWQNVHSEISVKAEKLESLSLWLQAASLQQVSMPTSIVDGSTTEPDSPQLKQDILRVDAALGIEHSALVGPEGQPLACHIQLKSQPGDPTHHHVSVHCGAVTACHVPGFPTDYVTFVSHPAHEGSMQERTINTDTFPTVKPSDTPEDPARGHANSISLSLSVLAIGAGALSASSAPSYAAWMNCSRLSCHLGSIRARGRPGSLVAGLFALQQGPSPDHGLRISAAGIQLGTVPYWQGGIDAHTLKPAGMQAFSNSFEVQVLLQGWPALHAPTQPQHAQHAPHAAPIATDGQVAWPAVPAWQPKNTSETGTDSKGTADGAAQNKSHLKAVPPSQRGQADKLVTLAVSSMALNMTGSQIATLAAVAGAATAESSRSFRQALPQQGMPPQSMCDQGKPGWLACLSLHTAAAYVMYAPSDTLPTVLAQPPKALRKLFTQSAEFATSSDQLHTAPAVPKWVLLCDNVRLMLAAGPMGELMPALSLALAGPHAWGLPGLVVGLPACDISIAQAFTLPDGLPQIPQQAHPQGAAHVSNIGASSHAGAASLAVGRLSDLSWRCIGDPTAVISNVSLAVESAGISSTDNVTISMSSISLDMTMLQLPAAVQLMNSTMTGPALPILPSYPPHSRPTNSSMRLHIKAHAIFGQLSIDEQAGSESTEAPVADLAFWLADADVHFNKSLIQVCCLETAPLCCPFLLDKCDGSAFNPELC